MIKKIGIIVILIISLMFLGCTESNSDIDNTNETLTNATNVNITPITKPELEIMSVTIVSENVNIKVKNVGNATAKDVYVGIVGISDTSYLSWAKPDYDPYIYDLAYEAMLHGSHTIESNTFLYPPQKEKGGFVLINSKLIHKEYIGDLEPNEMVISEYGILYSDYDEYIKMAWTSNYSEYTIH
ncbi:MAG: hypothetical protein K8R08_08160 [Methanosarcinales archaeon]|nr:hypothetical protein [Methanosarcinales archaeon]